VPGRDDRIAAVVTFAGNEEHGARIVVAKQFGSGVGNDVPGILHQLFTGNTGGDGPLVERADLRGGDRLHKRQSRRALGKRQLAGIRGCNLSMVGHNARPVLKTGVSTMKTIILTVMVVGLIANSLRADDAVEAKKAWERSASLGLSVTSGNSDSVLVAAGLSAHGVWPKDDWLLSLDGAYGKTDGTVSNEKLHGAAQYKHLVDERWYVTGVADALHDGVADLGYRLSIGPGVGYYFIKTDLTQLSADIGPSYVREKYNGQNANDFIAMRVGERFDRKLNEAAKVWQSLEYLPQVNDFSNYKAKAEVGLETAMTKTLSLRVVGQDEYNNRPSPGRKHNDMSLISSIVYKF